MATLSTADLLLTRLPLLLDWLPVEGDISDKEDDPLPLATRMFATGVSGALPSGSMASKIDLNQAKFAVVLVVIAENAMVLDFSRGF